MGTVFSIHIDAPGDWTAALADVIGLLHQVDAIFSTYRPDSDISRLDRRELRLRDCHPWVAEVLGLCAEVQGRSDGYFSALAGGRLDPSGLVKGWAIDRASELLSAAGSTSHAVNGGGDVQVVGGRADGSPWRIGVTHPLVRGALAIVAGGYDLAMATSGTAERGCHIVDPRTGRFPAGLASVTVTGPRITLVDAYATAAYAMGTGARGWLAGLAGYEAYAVTEAGGCWSTPGFPTVPAATQRG